MIELSIDRGTSDLLIADCMRSGVGRWADAPESTFISQAGWRIRIHKRRRTLHGDEEQLLSCAMQLAGLQGRNRTGVIQRLARVEAKILQTIDERRNA